MLTKNLFLFVLALGLSTPALAKKEMLILGGGGEPAGNTTIFDKTLQDLGLFSLQSGWNPSVVFNGGHKKTEELANIVGGKDTQHATTANLNKKVQEMKARIQRGDFKKGDQVMVVMATHGYPAAPPKVSHSVSSRDGLFDMDQMIELRKAAEKAGVKLAILDYSCHSGNSLRLSSDKTCVISAASTNIGYINAGEQISAKMKPGLNLEQVFLNARKSPEALSPGTPQISTEAGLKAYELTSYLSSSMKEKSSLDAALAGKEDVCGKDSPAHIKLARSISQIEFAMGPANFVKSLMGKTELTKARQRLETALANYKQERTRAQQLYSGVDSLNKERCVELMPGQSYCGTLEQFAYGYELLQKQAKERPSSVKSAEMLGYQNLTTSQDYLQWQRKKQAYNKLRDSMYWTAAEVAKSEREMYQTLYKHFSAESKKPNPCRDFKL